mmetsp:Transcript_86459/g.186953  ORF Transcript_86459/g.186953 Transcript_86459/m.186953 type:complete len:232 (+) Transcript_86459:1814-2509(+)
MMTRFALVRFRPTPPTFVVSSMHWKRSRWLLNFETLSARDIGSVWPSMRRQRSPLGLRMRIWIRSSIFTLWEKTSMRWPRFVSDGMSSERHWSLALWLRRASALRESFLSIVSTARPQRASSLSAVALPMASRLSAAASDAIRSRGSASRSETSAASAASRAAAFSASSCAWAAVTSESSSGQAPALGVGRQSSGWLQRRFRRPMARKTSMLSFCLAAASRMTSLFSSTFW